MYIDIKDSLQKLYKDCCRKNQYKAKTLHIIKFHSLSHYIDNSITYDTYSLSISATLHLYCAVENKQISANWRTVNTKEKHLLITTPIYNIR